MFIFCNVKIHNLTTVTFTLIIHAFFFVYFNFCGPLHFDCFLCSSCGSVLNVIYFCSHSQVIKVAISWEALIKLVQWFYSDELPNPPSGCLWVNMDDEEKLFDLQPYVELCWLAEFWMLENIQEACWNVIMSCLDSSKQLSVKIIKMAYNLSLWKLVDITANLLAPTYRQLRDSGELEEFDDALVHFISSASVQLNQEGENRFR